MKKKKKGLIRAIPRVLWFDGILSRAFAANLLSFSFLSCSSLTQSNSRVRVSPKNRKSKMERQRGDRFNGQQESQHQNQQLSDHHSHHEQQQQHHFNNSNYQVQDQQHLNNPNYHSNYHHHDQHFNNSNYQQHPPHHHNHHQHVNFEPNDSSSFGSGGFPPNSGAGGYGSGSGSAYSVRKRGRHRGDTTGVL